MQLVTRAVPYDEGGEGGNKNDIGRNGSGVHPF